MATAHRLVAGLVSGVLFVASACGPKKTNPAAGAAETKTGATHGAPPSDAEPASEEAPATSRDGSAAAEIEPGVLLEQTRLPGGEALWVYTPASDAVEVKDLVLIAPAGSNLITGMKLSAGDRPEHVPYVKAGYAVLAYELAGAVAEPATDVAVFAAIEKFRKTKAGLTTVAAVLNEATKRFPEQVGNGVLIAGHSSAATHALYVASEDPRIRAVAAYAPAIDVREHVGSEAATELEQAIPGFSDYLTAISPINRVADLTSKPVFLFSAKDDLVIQGQPARLASAISNKREGLPTASRHVRVESGGHYQSMIDRGIPSGIAWFDEIGK